MAIRSGIPIRLALAGLAAALAAAAQEPTPAQRAEVERAVLAVDAQVTRAGEARDAERLFAFMVDPEKTPIFQNGALVTREQVGRGLQAVTKVEYRWKERRVTVLSPSAAVLMSQGESLATLRDGTGIATPMAMTSVYVLTGGSWKILHAHQSSPSR